MIAVHWDDDERVGNVIAEYLVPELLALGLIIHACCAWAFLG